MNEKVVCDRCEAVAVYSVLNHGFFEVCCRRHLSTAVDASMFDGQVVDPSRVVRVDHEKSGGRHDVVA